MQELTPSMELRISKEELIRALSRVQGIVEKRSTNPIIANALLEVDENGLRVSATDTEVSFVGRHSQSVEVKRSGSITLGARQLYEIARLVPTDSVTLSLEEGSTQVEIRSGKAHFKVPGLSATDFPPIPNLDAEGGFEITTGALKSLVEKVLFSISSDDTRTGLNGAHVEVADLPEGKGSILRFVATDGHRLSLCGRPYQGEYSAPRSVLLPKKGLSELRKLCEKPDDVWRVSINDTTATFQQGSMAFSMRLLEGEFPDFRQVIPPSWQRRILLQRSDLVDALRRVSILSSEKSHPVRFRIADGTLTITARQQEVGEAKEELEAQVDGPDIEVGFNAKYFLDALGALATDTIAVEIGDSLSPCLVRPGEGDDDELYVIMPMRLE
jgi:DNA polymerase-3 subunit beta